MTILVSLLSRDTALCIVGGGGGMSILELIIGDPEGSSAISASIEVIIVDGTLVQRLAATELSDELPRATFGRGRMSPNFFLAFRRNETGEAGLQALSNTTERSRSEMSRISWSGKTIIVVIVGIGVSLTYEYGYLVPGTRIAVRGVCSRGR